VNARSIVLEARASANLSQRELARRSGVPQAAISRIEHGLVSPRTDTLDRLMRACGRDVDLIERPGSGIDRMPIRALFRMPPTERLRLATEEGRNLDRLLASVGRTR
jgi:transcriptional regulator with XRE-family HTH domain